jgi:hypothetical protein
MKNTIRIHRNDRIDVCSGRDAHRISFAQGAGIPASLLWVDDEQACQLEIGVEGHGLQRSAAYVPSRPLNDAISHRLASDWRCARRAGNRITNA